MYKPHRSLFYEVFHVNPFMRSMFNFLVSPKMALTLLFVFAISMGTATFVENDFGTQTARAAIYNSWWFEAVMILLGLNFMANIFRYKLYVRQKWPVLLFHIAFIIILIGAGISRYTGFEGIMRVREGAISKTIISDKNYLQVRANLQNDSISLTKEMYFSPIKADKPKIQGKIASEQIEVQLKEFIADAEQRLTSDPGDSTKFLELVLSTAEGRQTLFLQEGQNVEIGTPVQSIGFNNRSDQEVNFTIQNDSVFVESNSSLDIFNMSSQRGWNQEARTKQPLVLNTLYKGQHFSFVVTKYVEKGHLSWISVAEKTNDNDDHKDDLVLLEVRANGEQIEVPLIYRHGYLPIFKHVNIGELKLDVTYGALAVQTDFELKLRDFQMEKYPGSSSPSSYASEVTIIDDDLKQDYRIYMNHVLDYKGHRFFQASYDSDEKGTVLAVNRDRWGTLTTYTGYVLMGLGMLFTLFSKGSRFQNVNLRLKKLKQGPTAVLLLILLNSYSLYSRDQHMTVEIDSILSQQAIDRGHAKQFGTLMVQDLDGRVKPMNTLASEFLRKVSRSYQYKGENTVLTADQVFLAMQVYPKSWYNIPLIKVDKKKGGVFESMIPNKNGLVPFTALLDRGQNYILQGPVLIANEKKPAERSEYDKEVILVDERFNLVYNVLSLNYLKVFPKKDDQTKTWYNPNHDFNDFTEEDGRFTSSIIPLYFNDVRNAVKTGDWKEAEEKLDYIKRYQQTLGADIIPSAQRVEAELLYNRLNLNFWLFQIYFSLGGLLLVIAILLIFYDASWLKLVRGFLVYTLLFSFIFHSLNLMLRWYVAGYPPWSNGYEMIVFVSWGIVLFGFFFKKNSDFSLPLAAVFAGTMLFVSYLDWLSPEITNLMPVLRSYWLKIHVATIISSYAPLALSALLGVLAQLLIIARNSNNHRLLDQKIIELSYINEMSMTIGLFILSIGTFLGGVWANESWGRYWAWDPKETWALISIIVYSIVLHMRLIPGLNNMLVVNLTSTFAFFSIVMTSFGVNYYLTGLHSYATGDPVPVPNFIYVTVFLLLLLAVISIIRYRVYNKGMEAKIQLPKK